MNYKSLGDNEFLLREIVLKLIFGQRSNVILINKDLTIPIIIKNESKTRSKISSGPVCFFTCRNFVQFKLAERENKLPYTKCTHDVHKK